MFSCVFGIISSASDRMLVGLDHECGSTAFTISSNAKVCCHCVPYIFQGYSYYKSRIGVYIMASYLLCACVCVCAEANETDLVVCLCFYTIMCVRACLSSQVNTISTNSLSVTSQ